MTSGGPPAGDRDGMRPSRRSRAVRVARRMVEEWTHDRVPDTAAAVAFWAVLSLLPAFLALAALLGTLDAVVGADLAEDVQAEVLSTLETILTDEADEILDVVRDLFTEQRTGLLTFSLLAALWTLSRAFAALIRALDVVYDLDEQRGWLHVRVTAVAITLGSVVAAVVMLAAFVVGPLLGTGEQIADEIGLGDQFALAWDLARLPLAFVVLVAWAATLFHVAPDHRTPWRWDVPGALLTALLWLVFSSGLSVYIELASAGNAVFGALGGGLIALLWFWLLSLAVLLGGELNQVLLDELAPVHGPVAPAAEREGEQVTDARPARSDGVEGAAEAGDEGAGVERGAAVEEEAHDGRGHDHAVGGGGCGDGGLR